MTEREKWDQGVAAVRKEYAVLSPSLKAHLKECAASVKSCKQTLYLVGERVRAAGICAQCRGECCESGKNHVTTVELLVYLGEGKKIFTPAFEQGICPYLGEKGCIMEPEYRPFNCITFICERIEGLLGPLERERLYAVERELRDLYDDFELLFENSFRYGLLRDYERSLACNGAPILRGAALWKADDPKHESS